MAKNVMARNEKAQLTLLLLLSILLSTYLFFRTYVISLDGAFQYIPIAKDFASGLFRKALSHDQQPLYPLMVAFLSSWVFDFELAGKLISSFFGTLIIFPVYFLGRRIFEERIAFLSTFLLTIHPYLRRFSADVLKESTYLFFFATAIWFAWRTIQDEKKYPFLFIPIFSVLAYLVRPDGFEVLCIVFFYVLFIKKFSVPGRKRIVILLLILSSVALLLPYLFYLKEVSGEWTLSKAKSLGGLIGLEVMKDNVSLSHKIFYSLKTLNLEILAIFHPVYLFLLMIGLLKGLLSRSTPRAHFLLSLGLLHYLVLFLLMLNTTKWGEDGTIKVIELSGRHVLPLLLIFVYWVGEGFLTIYCWVFNWMESHRSFLPSKAKDVSFITLGALFVLILATVLPKTLKPQRYERFSEKRVGIWIKNQSTKEVPIFTTTPRVAYYAGTSFVYVDLGREKAEEIEASMMKKGAYYLVLQGKKVTDFPEEMQSIKNNFVEMFHYEKKGMEEIFVYKRVR